MAHKHFYASLSLFLLIVFHVCSTTLQANTLEHQIDYVGQVVDKDGEVVAGAALLIKGTTIGTLADAEGRFTISGEPNQKLVISMMGFKEKQVVLTTKTKLLIVLESVDTELEEVTVVAFSTQKKESVISSVSSINPTELKTPTSNLTTVLGGRISGMITQQISGEPGKDNAQFFIRGVTTFNSNARGPLILIDNVECNANDLARIQPDDIQAFSVLKDASATALYGARGANGVILVTTKEGREGKATLNVRFENVISRPTHNVDIADPITFMKLRNEAVATRDHLMPRPYSNKKIEATAAHLDPYAYPEVDWFEDMFKKQTSNQHLNASLSGGGKIAKYYIGGTFNNDTGLLKNDISNNFNNNIKMQNFQLRSNINIHVTNTTDISMRFSGSFEDYTGPIDGGSSLYRMALATDPVLFPKYFDPSRTTDLKSATHILFGNSDVGNHLNPYARMVRGYREYDKLNITAQLELRQNLDFLTKGLKARLLFNTKRYSYYSISRFYDPFYYNSSYYNPIDKELTLECLNPNGGTEYLKYSEDGKDIRSTTYLEGAIDYNRTFAEKHAVSGLLVYTMQERLFANQGDLQKSLAYRNMGLAGRFTYGYDQRYLVEANFGYNGSERFAKKKRFGFFPSVGLGWIVSNEPWYGEKTKKIVNLLKFKSTYGLVGNDQIGSANDRFFYLSNIKMDQGSNIAFGENFTTPAPIVTIQRYANDNISWEIAKKFDVGLEIGLFNSLVIQADYFREHRSKILMDRASIPSTMGLSAPLRANVGEALSHGYEISLDYNKAFASGLWTSARFNLTYAKGKFLKYEEPDYENDWVKWEGKPLNTMRGLVAERLFVDEADIANSPVQTFGKVMPGDIKYKDINGDEIINSQDIVFMGNPLIPSYIYGFGFSMGYKGFDCSMFMQAAAETSFMIDFRATAPFVNLGVGGNVSTNSLLSVWAEDHWSEANRNSYAKWPRLSNEIVPNNNRESTWWMRDGSYLRLKTVELGYTLPSRLTEKAHIKSLRIYLSGNNLFTLSNFKLWDVEMGGNGLNYPIQRLFNLGVNLSF